MPHVIGVLWGKNRFHNRFQYHKNHQCRGLKGLLKSEHTPSLSRIFDPPHQWDTVSRRTVRHHDTPTKRTVVQTGQSFKTTTNEVLKGIEVSLYPARCMF